RVLHEVPGPRTAVKAGRPVELVVSSGPVMIRVPLVEGEDVFQASQVLQVAGLRVRVRHVDSRAPRGQVVRQRPSSGTRAREGTEVTLWVSKGTGLGQLVPNLAGLTVGEASAQLAALNLALGSSTLQYSTQPANTIIDQSPAPYTKAAGVSAVSVVVSEGPSPASASATRNLSTARFQVPASAPPDSVVKVVITDNMDNEEVYYQRVGPGQTVNLPFVWYGTSGQLLVFLNGQAQPPTALVPNYGPSPAPAPGGTGNTTTGG
ncbi:MAG: PASTA domain-containing protein, partial [Firmicutes bacterium]|nr:PASTA domain-containing protein [Bacillota bacterium]